MSVSSILYDQVVYGGVGGHLGCDKTWQKVSERFYWKTLWSDVKDYIMHCDICQCTNDAKFQKSSAPLHPIPVKSKVWNMVSNFKMSPLFYCLLNALAGWN